MKRILSILIFLRALHGFATELAISNNAIACFYGDSWNADSGGAPDNSISGFRFEAYVYSYLVLNNPATNIAFYNWSRSGGTMDEMLTNRLQRLGLPSWGFKSNTLQLIGIANMTDNGAPDSNTLYLSMSNVFHAPSIMSDGSLSLTAQSGWASTANVQWIGLGEPPEQGSDGDGRQRDRNNAATNAGWRLGVMGIDVWNALALAWTNDFNANGGTNVQWLPRGGHFASGGALSWAFAFMKGFTADTNISTCTVDWSGSEVATNHCVVSGFSKSGNTLTFNRMDDRLPFAWDIPDGTITNDAGGAFNLIPSDGNYFQFTLQITNLPVGNYIVKIDDVTVAVLPRSALAAGWNMFTNYAGPYWSQRKEVLGRIRDLEHVDRVTLVPGSAGDGVGLQAVGSTLQVNWASGDRGDQLIADGNALVSRVQTNFTAIHAAAQPTNHTFSVTLAAPFFAPFHK